MLRSFRSFFHTLGHSLLLFIAFLLSLALFLGSLAPFISPKTFSLPNFFALVLPFLFFANLVVLIYWSLRSRLSAYIPLFGLLGALISYTNRIYNNLTNYEVPTEAAKELKILTYNVNLFHLYSWADTPPTFREIAREIERVEADIVCLQEFTTSDITFPDSLARKLFHKAQRVHYTQHHAHLHHGLALFSRFPIVHSEVLSFDESYNATIVVDLKIENDTVRVYNCHFQSFRLHRNNIRFIQSPQLATKASFLFEVKDILKKLHTTFQQQAEQVAKVKQHIVQSPYPTIVCGDFNTTPYTYTYSQLSRGLYDTFLEYGRGYGATFYTFLLPMRIDFILHSQGFFPTELRTLPLPYSDHSPVFATLRLKIYN